MLTVQEKTVDLTNYSSEDLFIKKADGGTLYIQVEGDASVSISGKTSELSTYVALPAMNMTTYVKGEQIAGPGFYMCVIGGLDQIKMEATGTGKMHWKVMGD